MGLSFMTAFFCVKETTLENISGYVENIIYRNAANGYSVLNLVSEEEVIVVGFFSAIDEGDTIEVKGTYTEHAVYGVQFKAESYEIKMLTDIAGIRRYLSSGAIKGIGPSLAERIIKKFAEDTFRIMEEEPERLAEVKGISERKAMEIGQQAGSKKELKDAMLFLQQFGISNHLAVKIYETYHMAMYNVLKENPYKMTEDIQGVGFKIADEIAQKVGIHVDSDYRIKSALLYTLLLASAEGHMYLPEEQLIEKTSQILQISKDYLVPHIANLMMDKKIMVKERENEKVIFGAQAYYAELNCAKMLLDLNIRITVAETEKKEIIEKIKRLEAEDSVSLDELQRDAILSCIENGIFILTGGPGTGKTTTINTMIKYFEREGMNILLAAPTGRAAKRMTEATGYEARTIHRMLELNAGIVTSDSATFFERNEENPLEADVIIIDEMSMVDIYLFLALLKAVSIGTRVIFVGDMNQLPSVGPGKVLKEMIDSELFAMVMLKKIFRQALESDIVMNAHKIHAGEPINLTNKSKDFFFLPRNDVGVIYKHMIQLITEKLPGYVGAKPFEIQVLTPMRKGPLGVDTLNKVLQEYLNPKDRNKKERIAGDTLFREGDKVMQIKNNYKLLWEIVSRYQIPIDSGMGVFNGDMGVVTEINEYAEYLVVEYDEHKRVQYPFSQLDELELAYAITIHKSQGSEYPAIVLPIMSGPRMLLNRNLLYTAVTRAKSCVMILGSSDTIQLMISNANEQKRFAALKDRLLEMFQIRDGR